MRGETLRCLPEWMVISSTGVSTLLLACPTVMCMGVHQRQKGFVCCSVHGWGRRVRVRYSVCMADSLHTCMSMQDLSVIT